MVAAASLQEAVRYCRWICRRSGSHFVASFRILPGFRREGMETVYAFCRAIDDVVDRNGVTEEQARTDLQRWRQELAACEEGFPAHPIVVALQRVCGRFEIPGRLFDKVLDGVEMDLRPCRFRTFEELKGYCDQVASAVGRISIRVFGCRHPAAEEYADALGVAFQLTNILRDLAQDAAQGRLYLPEEDLRRFGVTEADLLRFTVQMTGEFSDPFRNLMAFECERARLFFRQASEACRRSGEARLLLPARIMAAVYSRLLRRIEERNYDVFSETIRLSRWEQLGIVIPFALSLSKHEP